MFKFLYSDSRPSPYRSPPLDTADAVEPEAWRCDPLAHPAIAAMTQEELADLPAAELHPRGRC